MSDICRRSFLAWLSALTVAPAVAPLAGRGGRLPSPREVPAGFGAGVQAMAKAAPFHSTGLSSMMLTVSDVKRSLDFYQGLFGMPIQARQGTSVFLRIGNGPKFLGLKQAAAGERPSISGLGFAVERFDVTWALNTLAAHGVTPADAAATKPGPMQLLVVTRRADQGGSPDGTRDLFVADPSGVVFQMHDVSYCGGAGALGNTCRNVEASPKKGPMAMKDMSHFTIIANSPQTVPFYQDLFGFTPQAYQAMTPAWGVGDGVHFLMFTGNAGGPTRAGGAAPSGARGVGRGGAPRAGIDHACVGMDNFDPAKVTQLLVDYGLKKQEGQGRDPLVTYISLRMPNRGGAEGGTPELYFTDPDGLAIQLQDVRYCGGGGSLGEVCQ